jgi:hypothetical protein
MNGLKQVWCVWLLLLFKSGMAGVSVFELYPNIHTVGIMLVFDAPVADSVISNVYYEAHDGSNWLPVQEGMPLAKVTALQYAGCVFYTQPNTQYRVRVVLTEGVNTLFDATQTITTRNNPTVQLPLRTFYVSPSGSGMSQSISAPGLLNQSHLDSVQAGDKIILLPGTYYIGELLLKNSGTYAQPIQFEGMDSVVIDGSFAVPVQWARVSTNPQHADYNMFYANLGSINTNCVVVDGERLYPYRNRLELSTFQTIRAIDGNGYASGNFSFGLSGFFRDGRNPSLNHFPYVAYSPNTYIKFADGSDTTGKDIHVSRYTHCFSATGKSNIQFRNITFRYFGAARTAGSRSALFFEDCDSLLIDNCRFEFCDRGIFMKGDADDNLIQHCDFIDDLGDWSYLQFKDTNIDYGQLNTNYPNFFPYNYRNVEPGRIYFDRNFTGRGNIMRWNYFDGGCDGISCPVSPGDSTTSRHFDIYENEFTNGSDDAFEVDGNASNMRVWGNVFHHIAGVSAASPCYGPVYIFRNTFYDMKMGEYSYIYSDIAGYHLYHEYITGSPLKLNAAYCDLPGVVYFLHNTYDGGVNGKGFYIQQPQAQPSWANVISRNNIIYNESNDFTLWVRATDKVDLDYNNYFCTQPFKARQDRNGYAVYNSVQEVSENILGDVNDTTSFIETHSYQLNPVQGWVSESNNDYHLLLASNMLDKGVVIPGMNQNFSGTAPDLGAYEMEIIHDSVVLSETEIISDTVFTTDTITVLLPGINDTAIISETVITCDTITATGNIVFSSDTSFQNYVLIIADTLWQVDTLKINCNSETVDSVFIPDVGTAINNNSGNIQTVVFPNPGNSTFSVLINTSATIGTLNITVTDLWGKEVYRENVAGAGNLFSVKLNEDLPNGVYLLHVKNMLYYRLHVMK